ncbi:MAG: hypothetical protein KDA21_06915, partial [Phycisphaerales bacterium]|nr:hypothetical protein [Phycisphaerales bacterium]
MTPRPVRPILLSLMLAGTLAATGCDQRTDLADAIDASAATLSTLGGGGRALPAADVREQKYESVIRDLKGAMSSGTDKETEAAQAILAQAYAGRSGVHMERALRAEQETVRLVTRAHRLAGERQEFLSEADALKIYDRSPSGSSQTRREADIATIESQIEARQVEKAALERELAANNAARQTELDEMQAMRARAESERDRENAIRADAMDQGAVRRAELIRAAEEYRQRADAYEMAAMEAEVEADRYLPIGASIDLRIAQATAQVAQLTEALEAVETRAADLTRQAAEQESLARDRAKSIAEIVTQIQDLHQNTLTPAFSGAISDAEEAASTLNRAGRSGSGGLSVGGMKLAAAEAHDRYAASLERLARLYQAVTGVPGVQVDAAATQAAAQAQARSALQAWSDARDALQNGRASGDIAERIQRISERLPAMTRQVDDSSTGDENMDDDGSGNDDDG